MSGVIALGSNMMALAFKAVRAFTDFNADNDHYDEHDFGSVEINDIRFFWRIDYYDLTMAYGSEDPADAAQTKRVLTIMLAEEY